MRAISKIFLTFIVAFYLVVAAAIPANACAKPCCAQALQKQVSAGCEHCQTVKLSSPTPRCCQVAAEGESAPATLNTGARTHQDQPLTASVSGPTGLAFVIDSPAKPGYAFGTYKSPPVYKLTSTYRC